jgi:hypothetical protein
MNKQDDTNRSSLKDAASTLVLRELTDIEQSDICGGMMICPLPWGKVTVGPATPVPSVPAGG